jgi:hypothetical protein
LKLIPIFLSVERRKKEGRLRIQNCNGVARSLGSETAASARAAATALQQLRAGGNAALRNCGSKGSSELSSNADI